MEIEGDDVTDLSEPRVSLGEAAYRQLRADIIACRLVPGQRITEKQLSTDMGFGLAPVRDALTRLDHEGLVRTLPGKGYQVAPLTPKLIDDLFTVWEINGPELIRFGIRHATDEQIAAARAAFRGMDGATAEGRPGTTGPEIEAVNAAFSVLAEATGNSYLIALYRRLMGDMSRVGTLLLSDPTAVLAEPSEHWVLHVLAERDPDEAATKARRYIQEIHRRALQAAVRVPSIMSSEVVIPPST